MTASHTSSPGVGREYNTKRDGEGQTKKQERCFAQHSSTLRLAFCLAVSALCPRPVCLGVCALGLGYSASGFKGASREQSTVLLHALSVTHIDCDSDSFSFILSTCVSCHVTLHHHHLHCLLSTTSPSFNTHNHHPSLNATVICHNTNSNSSSSLSSS